MAKEAGSLMRLAQAWSLRERVLSVAGAPRQAVVAAHGSRVGCCLRLRFPSAAVFAAVRRSLRPLVTARGERKDGQVEGPEMEAGYRPPRGNLWGGTLASCRFQCGGLTEPMKAAAQGREPQIHWSETRRWGRESAGHPQLRNARLGKLRGRPCICSCPSEVRSALRQDSASETSLMKRPVASEGLRGRLRARKQRWGRSRAVRVLTPVAGLCMWLGHEL